MVKGDTIQQSQIYLNGFQTSSARDKHYEYCSTNGHVRVKMPAENEKWLKFHDG